MEEFKIKSIPPALSDEEIKENLRKWNLSGIWEEEE